MKSVTRYCLNYWSKDTDSKPCLQDTHRTISDAIDQYMKDMFNVEELQQTAKRIGIDYKILRRAIWAGREKRIIAQPVKMSWGKK